MLVDQHIKIEYELLERVRKLCIRRGDKNYLMQLAIRKYVTRLEEEKEKGNIKPAYEVEL